tara:strand:- start:135 stop:308 length:174 start_codon:yes stop_codon:yes gene_type:complete
MKLTIIETVTIRVLLKDSIEDYEQRIQLFNGDTETDMDYVMYYNIKIKELQEILQKL